jgi:SAM-dependent methyltransferase
VAEPNGKNDGGDSPATLSEAQMSRSTPATPPTDRPAFDAFEGYAVSSVLAGLEMAGLLEDLATTGLTETALQGKEPESASLLIASLRYLTQRGLVESDRELYRLTAQGRTFYPDRGYLVWLVGGYGTPLRHLDTFLTDRGRYGRDHVRDGEWVANGAALLGRADVVPYALEMLSSVNFRQVLDIGCGNARFLLMTCEKFGAAGVGVDISPEAVELATAATKAAGLSGRVEIVLGDAASLDPIPRLDSTDLVVTFFLLHEILAAGREVLVRYLADLAERLPIGARLLIAEVEPPDGDGPQRFTPEFSYVHALMGQILYTAADWTSALADGGFTVRELVRGGMPGGILILAEKLGR